MPDFRIVHQPAIDRPRAISSAAISLEPLPEGHVIHVLADPAKSASFGDFSHGSHLRGAGPGQWYLVGDEALGHADISALTGRLAQDAYLVDVSHGRVRIAICGTAVFNVLAKGTAVDPVAMPVGHSTTTLIGHISVHMTRIGAESFELMVLRGFAESLWDDLAHMCAEFA